MTLRESISQAETTLAASDLPSPHPRLDAESLLLFALGREGDRAYLLTHLDLALDGAISSRYSKLIEQRATGRPMQYITGHQEFFSLDFLVTPAVLIPRPETEHAVEAALAIAQAFDSRTRELESEGRHKPSPARKCRDSAPHVSSPALAGRHSLRILDVGTGSGCIAIALSHSLPHAQVVAVDLSAEALAVARENADRHKVQIEFLESDLLAALPARNPDDQNFDLIISNPPYIGTDHPDTVQQQVRDFEPALALWGGANGLETYARLIPQAYAALNPGGHLVLEIGYSIAPDVRALFPPSGWQDIKTIPDLQGIPRVITAQKRLSREQDGERDNLSTFSAEA